MELHVDLRKLSPAALRLLRRTALATLARARRGLPDVLLRSPLSVASTLAWYASLARVARTLARVTAFILDGRRDVETLLALLEAASVASAAVHDALARAELSKFHTRTGRRTAA